MKSSTRNIRGIELQCHKQDMEGMWTQSCQISDGNRISTEGAVHSLPKWCSYSVWQNWCYHMICCARRSESLVVSGCVYKKLEQLSSIWIGSTLVRFAQIVLALHGVGTTLYLVTPGIPTALIRWLLSGPFNFNFMWVCLQELW